MRANYESPSSSPDPLAISIDNASPTSRSKVKSPTSTPRKPLRGLNGNIRLQDFYLVTPPALSIPSPTKSTAQTDDLLSPWRIRVTVEAEREETQEKVVDKTVPRSIRLAERSNTTTIPLKPANDSSPTQSKRGRGRPRKSSVSPRKRNGTPKPSRRNQYTVQNIPIDAKPTPPRTGKGRQRSDSPSETMLSNRKASSMKPPKHVSAARLFFGHDGKVTTVQRKSRGRRKAITPVGMMLDPDNRTIRYDIQRNDSSHKSENLKTVSSMNTSSTTLDNRPARKSLEKLVGPEHEYISRPTNSSEDSVGLSFAVTRPYVQQNLAHSVDLDESEGADECQVDPIDEYRDSASLIESEGFSMISISSLSSTRQYSDRAEERTSVGHDEESVFVDEEISETAQDTSRHVEPSPEQSYRISVDYPFVHNINSSPPYYMPPASTHVSINGQTPTIALTSPSLPPPLQAAVPRQALRSPETTTTGAPKFTRVVHAGVALQGVLDPSKSSPGSRSHSAKGSACTSPVNSPDERLDDLFGGFGAGTRRELRAGLRLGEELAKRQKLSRTASQTDFAAKDRINPRAAQSLYPVLQIPDSNVTHQFDLQASTREVQHPCLSNDQLPSPERSVIDADDDPMSWVAGTSRQKNTTESPQSEIHSGQTFIVDASLMAREQDWQREREAISRQIQMANTSQVIVINSDSEDDTDDRDDDDGDIWQEEARSSNQIRLATPESMDLPPQEAAIKPKRNKLPSPWRRNSEVPYSDDPMAKNAGLFWQPDLRRAQIAKHREDRREKKCVLDTSIASASTGSITDLKVNQTTSATSTSELQSSEPTQAISREKNVKPDQREDERSMEAKQPVVSVHAMSKPNHDSADHRTENPCDTNDQLQSLPTGKTTQAEHNISSRRNTTTILRVHTEVELDAQESQRAQDRSESTILGDSTPTSVEDSQNVPPTTPQPALRGDRPSTSWLSRLSTYFTSAPLLVTSMPSPPTAVSSSHSARHHDPSSSAGPLSPYQPFDIPHYRALLPIYHESRLNHTIRPFNPQSISAELLGRTIYSHGFSKDVEGWELGVVDAFMNVLTELRNKTGSQEGKDQVLIDEKEVAKRVFSLHIGMVARGECAFGGIDMPEKWKRRLERGEWAKKGERLA